ncbi:MAG TPA: KEOPS complex subunit Cgi121, partial [Nitrososphaerales archaeon]|nr:KEOPS complex subunit Cgi121 [Nitrososphaerales archaeon]
RESTEYWSRRIGKHGETLCFAIAFDLGRRYDLTAVAKEFPEGVVLCNPGLIAGIGHLEEILLQTKEYWDRNQRIVRNGSLEILMRITCQRQISEAIVASQIADTETVALLGFVASENEIEASIERLYSACKSIVTDNSLLDLTREKASKLRRFHRLPSSLPLDKLQTALQERSILLIFSK